MIEVWKYPPCQVVTLLVLEMLSTAKLLLGVMTGILWLRVCLPSYLIRLWDIGCASRSFIGSHVFYD